MADHDDQISNNRRRLFKALSTAPVVMTLRPGEALANSSAIQCAANEMPAATVKFYKSASTAVCSSDTGAGCHAFVEKHVWDPKIINVDNGQCAFWSNKFVVETSDNTYYVIENSGSSGSGQSLGRLTLSATPEKNVAVLSDGNMAFYGSNKEQACAVVGAQTGLFLAVGGPTPDSENPTGWASTGVWPEYADTTTNVLGGSCLTSFPSSSGFTLADG